MKIINGKGLEEKINKNKKNKKVKKRDIKSKDNPIDIAIETCIHVFTLQQKFEIFFINHE